HRRHEPTSPGRWGIRSRMAVPATPAATTSPAATPRASTAATQAGPVARRSGGTGAVPTAGTCTSAAVTRDSSSPTTRPAGTAPATTAAARLNRETRRVPGRTPSLSQANSSADSSRRSATTSRITARIATSTATSALTVSRLAAPRATGSPESRSCRARRRVGGTRPHHHMGTGELERDRERRPGRGDPRAGGRPAGPGPGTPATAAEPGYPEGERAGQHGDVGAALADVVLVQGRVVQRFGQGQGEQPG